MTGVPKYSIDENENNLNIREIVNIVKINGEIIFDCDTYVHQLTAC